MEQSGAEYTLAYAGKMKKEDILADKDGSFPISLRLDRMYGEGGEWKNILVFGDNLQFLKTTL